MNEPILDGDRLRMSVRPCARVSVWECECSPFWDIARLRTAPNAASDWVRGLCLRHNPMGRTAVGTKFVTRLKPVKQIMSFSPDSRRYVLDYSPKDMNHTRKANVR